MTLSPYFPTILIGLLPGLISFLKLKVPPLYRELMVLAVAVLATIGVTLFTPLGFAESISQGVILFVMLTGTWAGVTGSLNVAKAKTEVGKTVLPLLALGVLVFVVPLAGAQDTTAVDSTTVAARVAGGGVKEALGQTIELWLMFGVQYLAKLLDRFLKV